MMENALTIASVMIVIWLIPHMIKAIFILGIALFIVGLIHKYNRNK